MPTSTYAYKVRDRAGKVTSGSLDAESTALVANKLREMGYVPIAIEKKAAVSLRSEITIPGLSNRVKLKDVAVFSRQFATMINAGLTLIRSLSILRAQTPNTHFATIIDQVSGEVQSGSSLSQALSHHPKQFNDLYVSMVRAGEVGGNLDLTLTDLADTMEKQVELRSKIRSALAYPVAVLALVLCILAAMLLFIVPIFKKMYSSLGGKLPLPTRILVSISNVTVHYFPWVFAVVVIAALALRRWVRTPSGREVWDRLKLRPPVVGELVRKTAMTRFASTLSTLLRSGVPVLESLDITADTVGNVIVANGVRAVAEGAKRGEPMTRALSEHPVFPPMVTQMLSVGEESGAIDSLLEKVAAFFDQEISATVNALTSLLEPLLIVVLGAAVGAMVISLYLPMFDIVKLVGNNG